MHASLVATWFKEQSFKQLVNHPMTRPTSKPWDVYDSKKNDGSTIKGERKITLFVIHCGQSWTLKLIIDKIEC
jgi:hypothetical protein